MLRDLREHDGVRLCCVHGLWKLLYRRMYLPSLLTGCVKAEGEECESARRSSRGLEGKSGRGGEPPVRRGGASSPRPLPRSGGQLGPLSHAGGAQLRPANLRVRPPQFSSFPGKRLHPSSWEPALSGRGWLESCGPHEVVRMLRWIGSACAGWRTAWPPA